MDWIPYTALDFKSCGIKPLLLDVHAITSLVVCRRVLGRGVIVIMMEPIPMKGGGGDGRTAGGGNGAGQTGGY